MTDIRLKRLGDVTALPALREVYVSVIKAGDNPSPFITDEYMQRVFLREARDEQIAWLDPM